MFAIGISTRRFRCPVSGLVTRTGDACAQDEAGRSLHISQMPIRKLVPLKEYLNANKTGK